MSSGRIPVVIEDRRKAFVDFTIILEGADWRVTQRWNGTLSTWYLDWVGITYPEIEIYGLGCKSGVNIFAKSAVAQLGELYLYDTAELDEDPTYESFGVRHILLYRGLNDALE